MGTKVIRKLKLIRIPREYRDETFKRRAIQAVRDVFSPLFFTLNAQIPTPAIDIARRNLTEACEAYEAVIHETYDKTLSPGETILETAQKFS